MAATTVQFLVTVQLELTCGKFAGRDELADQVREQLQDAADEGVYGVGADGDTPPTNQRKDRTR